MQTWKLQQGSKTTAIAGDKPSLLQDALQLLIEDAKAQIMRRERPGYG